MSFSKSQYKHLVIALLSAMTIFCILSPFLSQHIGKLFSQKQLIESNEQYVEKVEHQDRKTLLLLADIRSLIYVLQSSEIGVSFFVDADLSIGEVLAPLSQISDKAFEATTASLLALTGIKLLLVISEYVAPYFGIVVLLSIFIFSISCFFSKETNLLKSILTKISEIALVLFLFSHLVVPYGVHIAAQVNHDLWHEMRVEHHNNLRNLHDTIYIEKHQSLKDKVKSDITELEKIIQHLPHKVEYLMTYYVEHLVLSLLSNIVIPIGLLLILFFPLKYLVMSFCLPSVLSLLSQGKPEKNKNQSVTIYHG